MPPVISIVGKSSSGKTTLVEKLIPELRSRGLRVGSVKHAPHGFEADQRGKDSWRHKKAGADAVIVASPDRIVLEKPEDGNSLETVTAHLSDMDIILTEGYKRENRPKIEVFRARIHPEPLWLNTPPFALVTDSDTDAYPGTPRLGLDAIKELADLIQKKILEET
ncbi:MAG: molybdopterin-guanine dinucleotide biosynthesis protein B [Desulfobacterales bacterium]|nr:molybdopterin-guanine dinucleotide biosynthesis protein B [Desulfobacterales bacterium]